MTNPTTLNPISAVNTVGRAATPLDVEVDVVAEPVDVAVAVAAVAPAPLVAVVWYPNPVVAVKAPS